MKLLVTGGAGFIGSNAVDAFLAAGHDVAVLDDLSSGRRENLPDGVDVFAHDIRSNDAQAAVRAYQPDVLCHHAAQMDVRRSVADPAFDADVNVVGSLRLLETCRDIGCTRVVFASTGGAIYGEQDVFPADETHATRPMSPYGVAKLSVEKYLDFYRMEYGFQVTSLRYANVYGPRQNPHGEAGVVAIFCSRLLSGEPPMIFGDGGQTRDFVYVGDVVRANVLAVDADLSGTFNVGTSVETSVNELYSAIRAAVGTDIDATPAAGKPGEQRRSVLDAGRLQRTSDWRASTSLATGIAETVAYFADAPRR